MFRAEKVRLRIKLPELDFQEWCSAANTDSSARQALLDALHAFQALDSFFMQDVDVKFFHDLHDDAQRLEEAVHSDAKHAGCGGFIMDLQDSVGVWLRYITRKAVGR